MISSLLIERLLARIIHHTHGASLWIRHHSTFASFANTTSIRSVTKSTVMSNPYAIRSLSGELSRLDKKKGILFQNKGIRLFASFRCYIEYYLNKFNQID